MELEVLALDAEKAFDTVNHDIRFNKLYQDGVEGDMWSLMNNMYKGMTFKVKWDNNLTDNINIAQGIRQCAKLSTLLYKRYNNTILNSLTIRERPFNLKGGVMVFFLKKCSDSQCW